MYIAFNRSVLEQHTEILEEEIKAAAMLQELLKAECRQAQLNPFAGTAPGLRDCLEELRQQEERARGRLDFLTELNEELLRARDQVEDILNE